MKSYNFSNYMANVPGQGCVYHSVESFPLIGKDNHLIYFSLQDKERKFWGNFSLFIR